VEQQSKDVAHGSNVSSRRLGQAWHDQDAIVQPFIGCIGERRMRLSMQNSIENAPIIRHQRLP
jgi:hypothetical protein